MRRGHGGRHAVDGQMLRRRNREIGLTPRQLAKCQQDRIVEIAGELAAAELRFARGS